VGEGEESMACCEALKIMQEKIDVLEKSRRLKRGK
jgi:hypothetical protein